MYKRRGKRLFDLIFAVTGLIVLSPLFVSIAAILWFLHRGKPIFRQSRPGLNGKIFTIFKFRTISDSTLNFSDRNLTFHFCQFLRRTSLDEIPQLWNVLLGEMSMVGPRPLLSEYLALYNSRQMLRHNVLPGITGLAQINGRNLLPWEEKFEFDVAYIENQSFRLDIEILMLTIKKVVMREGCNAPTVVFKGSDSAL
jgi:undecaprenyl phosphate N,N'-diacetylbacillosamine 1-phosphate transferase